MPRLVRTPEDILRATGRDVYLIQFSDVWGRFFKRKENPDGRDELFAWLAENRPHLKPELVGPSEFSGVLVGGIGHDYAIDFSEDDLQAFCAAWETDDGHSIDRRFQCVLYTQEVYARCLAEKGDPRDWTG